LIRKIASRAIKMTPRGHPSCRTADAVDTGQSMHSQHALTYTAGISWRDCVKFLQTTR